MPKRKSKENSGLCPFCHREKNLNEEHVIPDTLFSPGDTDKLVINICHQCNNGMSAAVRDLRNLIALGLESLSHPDAIHHLRKIVDTNEATKIWLKKAIDDAEEVDFVTEDGIVIGQALATEFNKEPARKALAQIVRGLYFVTTGTPLPYGVPISVMEIPITGARQFVQNMTQIEHGEIESRGSNVATWVPYTDLPGQGAETTAWILIFWNSICFFGGTGAYAQPIETMWQEGLDNADNATRIDGRRQILSPRQPNGQYYVPPYLAEYT